MRGRRRQKARVERRVILCRLPEGPAQSQGMRQRLAGMEYQRWGNTVNTIFKIYG